MLRRRISIVVIVIFMPTITQYNICFREHPDNDGEPYRAPPANKWRPPVHRILVTKLV